MLSDAVEFVVLDRDEIGIGRTWKFVTSGAEIADTAPINFTWTGENRIQGKNLAVSTGRCLTPADFGKTITNEGATAEVEYELPVPVEETEYKFVVTDSAGIKITSPAGAAIRFGADETKIDGTLVSETIGSYLTVRVVAGVWTATNVGGVWVVD